MPPIVCSALKADFMFVGKESMRVAHGLVQEQSAIPIGITNAADRFFTFAYACASPSANSSGKGLEKSWV